jgi:hypothetical protein
VDRLTQEPEKIKRWREDQKSRIEVKDADEEVRKRELKEAAKRELDEWYRNRQDQLAKAKENNKQYTPIFFFFLAPFTKCLKNCQKIHRERADVQQ